MAESRRGEARREAEEKGRDGAGCLSTGPGAAGSWGAPGASLAPPLPLSGSGEVEEDREVVEEVLEVEECGDVSEEEGDMGKVEGGSEWGSEDSSPPAEVEATEVAAAADAPAAPPTGPAPLPLYS